MLRWVPIPFLFGPCQRLLILGNSHVGLGRRSSSFHAQGFFQSMFRAQGLHRGPKRCLQDLEGKDLGWRSLGLGC